MIGEHRLRRGAGGGRVLETAFHPKCKQEEQTGGANRRSKQEEQTGGANRRSKQEERESAAEDLRRSAREGEFAWEELASSSSFASPRDDVQGHGCRKVCPVARVALF